MSAARTEGADRPVNLLVVDDRPENRLALKAVLASPGYRIVEAGSGREALRRLLDEEFAVLLLDVMMPEMTGFELAAAVKQREKTANVPILFLTAQAVDLALVYRGYEVGAVDYLTKPLVPEMVRAKVAVFAELYRQRRRIEEQGRRLVEAERREGELRLVEQRSASDRRYRTLAEAVPHLIWTARPDGSCDYFNRHWFEYTGLTVEQTGGTFLGALHPDDRARGAEAWQRALATGGMFECECRLRRGSDDAYRWHLGRAVPEAAAGGRIASWLGTFTDIDDQKRSQAVLAEFKGTLDAVLDAVLIFGTDDLKFVYLNRGAEELWGLPAEQLLRRRLCELLVDHDERRLREELAPLRDRSRGRVVLEAAGRRRDGREVPVELAFELAPGGDHVVSIARDLTERHAAALEREQLYAEALAAIRARDEFLSVASHELRTPLSSLKLQLDLLRRAPAEGAPGAPTPEKTRDRLEAATRQVDRLVRLVAELMDVSRITAGRLRLERERLDLAALAGEVVGRFEEDAAKAGSELTVHSAGPVTGSWDRLRLEQIVVNLVANALKFGAGRPVEVTVESDGRVARLVVTDHGIGIAPEDTERIFERFERSNSALRYGGLGLGLYIVRQIVEAHGGTIRVASRPDVGSTFTIELPPEPLAPEAPAPADG